MRQEGPTSPVIPEQSRMAKARLAILGYEGPDLGKRMTWYPTLRRDYRNLIFNIIAHRGYDLFTLDAKTAFPVGEIC